jgi:hypothetical protein
VVCLVSHVCRRLKHGLVDVRRLRERSLESFCYSQEMKRKLGIGRNTRHDRTAVSSLALSPPDPEDLLSDVHEILPIGYVFDKLFARPNEDRLSPHSYTKHEGQGPSDHPGRYDM